MISSLLVFLFSTSAFSNTLYVSEALIDGKVSQVIKEPQPFVKAGEIIYYLENMDAGFVIDKVPVRAPISGYIQNLWLPKDSTVKKGEKLFSVVQKTEDAEQL